jgi:hypothetical protein
MEKGRAATLLVWLECATCGRIDKAARGFTYPADLAEDVQLFVWQPCDRCGNMAKLHMKRTLKRHTDGGVGEIA